MAVFIIRLYKHTMVFTLDLIEGVAKDREKIIVGCDDCAIEVKFDHGLGTVHGRDLAGVVHDGGIQPFHR